MSTNYEEEEDYSSYDEMSDNEEHDRALFPDRELAEDDNLLFYRFTAQGAPFSLPMNDGHEDPHFTIFNNKEIRDNDNDDDMDGSDLMNRKVMSQNKEMDEVEDPKDEAFSSRGQLDQRSRTQGRDNQSMREDPNSDLFRRRELYDARSREAIKNSGSRRRTLASPSPTSLEEKDQETVTNEQYKLAETGTQEVNENLFLGSITNRELGRLLTTQPRGTKTTKDTTENKRSMLRPVNDDLGITDTARQRSEALGEAGSSTQRYNDQQLIASVMSKKKEQATRKGIIPKQNQDVSDTPSSASGGIIGKIITTKHQREFKNENKSPENFPFLRELD